MRWRVVWRCILATTALMLALFVVNYHLPFSGVKKIDYDFKGPDGTISHLYPVARVRDMARADGRSYRPMIEDPVYYDVRTLVPYKRARIELIYNNKTGIPLKMGMKRAEGGSDFELHSLEGEVNEGGWTRGSISFDLSRASYYNNKYTFAFSVPGLRTEQADVGEVYLSHMRLILGRQPLSWNDISSLWKKF